MRALAMFLVAALSPSLVAAQTCEPLKPSPPLDESEEFSGKIGGEVDGLFSGLVGVDADVEGTYKKVASNVLERFPNADKVYIWERVLYLECLRLTEGEEAADLKTLQEIGVLSTKYKEEPPEISAAPAQRTQNVTGDKNISQQGENNQIGDVNIK